MVTEVWAEPQHGYLTDLNSELKYLEGLQYNEVPNAVSILYGLVYITCIGCKENQFLPHLPSQSDPVF